MLTLRAVRKSTDHGTRIELTLSGADLPSQLQAGPIFFELVDGSATDLTVMDGFVGGLIHFLMETRQNLHVEGRLSRTCLRNLTDYQRFWSLVRPNRCSAVRITADEIVADRADVRDLPAVANYSGGIDSSFTVARHSLRLCGMESVPPRAVMLVHGFDVPLANENGFSRLLDRLQPVIEELGLKRYVVKTNLREMALQDWLDSYSAQLVSCLHMVSDNHSTALIASDGYAQSPIFDYAGNPITVPLLTTSRLKILYDGGPYGRTEKIRLLSNHPTILRSVKFCWEGADVERNCGRCAKCFLTYMNFRGAGIEEPDCFDAAITPAMVGSYVVRNKAAFILGYEALQWLWRREDYSDWTEQFSLPVFRYEEETIPSAGGAAGNGSGARPCKGRTSGHRCCARAR